MKQKTVLHNGPREQGAIGFDQLSVLAFTWLLLTRRLLVTLPTQHLDAQPNSTNWGQQRDQTRKVCGLRTGTLCTGHFSFYDGLQDLASQHSARFRLQMYAAAAVRCRLQ